jgi:hypothetical protein
MVKTIKMSKGDKEVMKQILEAQPAKNIGELRKIDKICKLLESNEITVLIDDDLFELAKTKIEGFDGQFVAAPAIRAKTLRVADILDGKEVPLEEEVKPA